LRRSVNQNPLVPAAGSRIFTLVPARCSLSAPATVSPGIFPGLARPRHEDPVRRLTLVLVSCALALAALGAQQCSVTLEEALRMPEVDAPAVVQPRGLVAPLSC